MNLNRPPAIAFARVNYLTRTNKATTGQGAERRIERRWGVLVCVVQEVGMQQLIVLV